MYSCQGVGSGLVNANASIAECSHRILASCFEQSPICNASLFSGLLYILYSNSVMKSEVKHSIIICLLFTYYWYMLAFQVNFEKEPRERYIQMLGYDKTELAKKVKQCSS